MEEENKLIVKNLFRKDFLNKVLIYSIIIIGVVTTASIAGIIFAEQHNKKMLAEHYIDNELPIDEEEIETLKEDNRMLPIYSEAAKERIKNIYVADSDEKIAYLTFDDGPSKNITPQILEILEREKIKATFFVLGNRVELYPELVREEYEAGHYIANHSYSHEYASVYDSPEALLDEFNRTEIAIQEALDNPDYHTHLFRFPGGSEGGKYKEQKNAAKSILAENEIEYINWNALTRDAEGKPTAESLVSDLKATVGEKKRVVVLMHDTGSKQLTADTLPEVIQYLREEGFVFKNFYDIMK